MAMNQVSSGARALDSGTTLKSRSDYGRNADGSRQSPASAWASRLVMRLFAARGEGERRVAGVERPVVLL